MSQIYKALEKEEREREKDLKKDFPFALETVEEKKRESHGMSPDLPKSAGVMSYPQLVSFFQPRSLAAEQFRKLRTYLLRHKISEVPKTIMVTSATSSEGKTFVAANLAIGIAHDLHAYALLVDCDFRNPMLARWFGVENGKGISDYLMGDGKISEFLTKTEIEKLRIFPGGTVRDNPTELMGSKKMEALIHELKSRYSDRYIIFDSTPLLDTSEPEVLGKLVDAIIIVVRAGATQRETVKQAIASLEKDKIFGLVLNGLEFKSSGLSSRYFGLSGYYYKYGYRYGYGKKGAIPQSRWGKLFRFTKDRS